MIDAQTVIKICKIDDGEGLIVHHDGVQIEVKQNTLHIEFPEYKEEFPTDNYHAYVGELVVREETEGEVIQKAIELIDSGLHSLSFQPAIN